MKDKKERISNLDNKLIFFSLILLYLITLEFSSFEFILYYLIMNKGMRFESRQVSKFSSLVACY